MSTVTKLNLSGPTIKKLLTSYDLKLVGFKSVTAGVENSSVFIFTESGKYVLRVYRASKEEKEIRTEIDFMNFLSGSVPVPKIILNNKGDLLTSQKIDGTEWCYIVMEFLEGKHLEGGQLNLIPEISKYQALMHEAAVNFQKNRNNKVNTLSNEISYFENHIEKFRDILGRDKSGKDALKIADKLNQETRSKFNTLLNLPTGFIHRDYDSDNIITTKDRVQGIIDFDDLAYQPFALDLANTLWWWISENQENSTEILRQYLSGYEKIRKLSSDEKNSLLLFARRRNIAIGVIFQINQESDLSSIEIKKTIDLDSLLVKLLRQQK